MYYYYEPEKPIEVKGGIKASLNKKEGFGKNWWAKKWIDFLESFNLGQRLIRGKTYAKKGQVVYIDINKGFIDAKVQGTTKKPYKISIKMKVLNKDDWDKILKELTKQAIFTAQLLSYEMPQNIEEIFKNANLSLFPSKYNDIITDCSCPDWSNPCKHIAAVYYILGEEFSKDPFLIFKLRGLTKEELLNYIKNNAGEKITEKKTSSEKTLDYDLTLETNTELFWEGQNFEEKMDSLNIETEEKIKAPILRELGGFPMWRRKQSLITEFLPYYEKLFNNNLDILEK